MSIHQMQYAQCTIHVIMDLFLLTMQGVDLQWYYMASHWFCHIFFACIDHEKAMNYGDHENHTIISLSIHSGHA